MRLGTAVLMLPLFLVGCTAQPPLTFGQFQEQILEPLARQRAADILDELKAQAVSPGVVTLIYRGLDVVTAGVAGKALEQADTQQRIADLEGKRTRYREKILTVYIDRGREFSKPSEGLFAVCANGRLKQWRADGGRFVRQDDGPPCPASQVNLDQ